MPAALGCPISRSAASPPEPVAHDAAMIGHGLETFGSGIISALNAHAQVLCSSIGVEPLTNCSVLCIAGSRFELTTRRAARTIACMLRVCRCL